MKKTVCLILALMLVFSLPTTTHASEIGEYEYPDSYGDIVAHQEFPMLNNSKTRESYLGDGGVSTLEYLSLGYIHWSVTPNTVETYTFAGTVTIYSSSGAYIYSESCFAYGTGFQSGLVDLTGIGLKKGTLYKAKLTGQAVDSIGSVFTVADEAKLSFTYTLNN